MAEKRPLVYVDGRLSQLPPGDSLDGASVGTIIAGSGLVGGGTLDTGDKRLDVALAVSASGLFFVGTAIGLDGTAQVTATSALASGNAGLVLGTAALSSGTVAQSEAETALASGNAALNNASNVALRSITLTAASTVQVGNPVGVDDTGRAQVVLTNSPTISGRNNFFGVAQTAAASGETFKVSLPLSIDQNQTGLSKGSFYYVDPTTSGFTTASGQPPTWSGAYYWGPVGKAVSSSGLLLLNPL